MNKLILICILFFVGCRDEQEDFRLIKLRKQEVNSITGSSIKSFTESGYGSEYGTGHASEIVIITEDNKEIRIKAFKNFFKTTIKELEKNDE